MLFNDGYVLLSDSYVNSSTKLKYRCNEGHVHEISWNSWQQGRRCPACAGVAKPTIKFINRQFEKEYYELLSKEYVNSKSKLDYICSEGHEHNIRWNDWEQGHRCPTCSGNSKPTIEFVKSEFAKEGYELLEDVYIDAFSKMKYKCPEGHKNIVIWNSWQQGHRCPTCSNLLRFGSGNVNWQGGLSFEPYCEVWKDKQFKADIRERDGNICQNPDCWGTSDKLSIHHIDYDKKNCHPDNLITVCASCNARANTNREWHTEYYKDIKNKEVTDLGL